MDGHGRLVKPIGYKEMNSTSNCDYRKKCCELLRRILKAPKANYRSLRELQAILDGHYLAFEQLGYVDRKSSFHRSFSDWLRVNYKASCSAGWDVAIELLAKKDGSTEPENLFLILIEKFLQEWENLEGTTTNNAH